MKFTVSSSALYSRLAAAAKVMAAKNSMPILECFLLNVRNGEVCITASDGDKYFITAVPLIDSDNNAALCLPAKTIMESIKELAEQPLTIEYNPETLEVKGIHMTGSFNMMAQPANTYPMQQPLKENATIVTLPSEILLTGINRCLFATANDELRMVMTGVYLDIHTDDITIAGTDGRKLVRYTNRNVQPGVDTGFILPKKVAAIVKSLLQKEDEVTLAFDNERANIKNENFEFYFRMIEGNYPNYNSVIPTGNPFVATVDRMSLIGALKRVSVLCNQSTGLMKLNLENNQMQLTVEDYDFATSARETLLCEYNNSPICIGFNCHYMIELANVLSSESLTIQLADPSRPGIIVPAEEEEGEETLTMLMPMMLTD